MGTDGGRAGATGAAGSLGVGAPVVGVIGAGQLARMMQPPAVALGVRLRVLAARADDCAAQVIPDVVLGSHDDPDAVVAFARGCDVVTFDHEHVPTAVLERLIEQGVAVHPGADALLHAQDKAVMREQLGALGVPVPRWTRLDAASVDAAMHTAAQFARETGWPFILKAIRGGYDGKGVWRIETPQQLREVVETAHERGVELIAEVLVPFVRELSAQVARSPHGQAVAYPVVETVQRDGVCREVYAPAPGLGADRSAQAQRIALTVARELDVTGMLAVELFQTADGALSVNELAMRPHNSGHWSIDGAVTSQFENHLRAVLDLPLGAPTPHAPVAVMANVLGLDLPDVYPAYLHCMARDPGLKIHMYGKAVKPGRKIGHVTVLGDNLGDCVERATHAAAYLRGEIDE
ncbi:5-(carboxyamino)imidazole ribonucleotide synthase [Actinocrinis puniceicyclus]|uniref:N5-carboxyaminoimidazole ribonucleotide synthase n=2 Tax=Actinocrinis puniceicyclus TaxID=977794 RepID=A0A8J7WSI8_9ACTN|nr:5-(carboxyamino)imidazole ribonucleotide synthase [Actinocrinis puniceicyclus]